MEFQAECNKCGRYIGIKVDLTEGLIRVKTDPCYGCVRKIVTEGLKDMKKKIDTEIEEEEPCQK